jgi:hypothetical protein
MNKFVVGFLFAGCATVVPLQAASVVPSQHLRVGGQLAFAAFCGNPAGGIGGLANCSEYPDGIPFPELRVNGRYGLGHGADVGASVQFLGQLISPERAFQTGLTFDLKREMLHVETGPVSHVISFALLGGGALAGRFGLPLWAQLEGGIPLFYGLQTSGFEVVLGGSLTTRLTFPKVGAQSYLPTYATNRLSVSLGLFRRPSSWGLQLGYLVSPEFNRPGAIQLQFGWNFERSLAPDLL